MLVQFFPRGTGFLQFRIYNSVADALHAQLSAQNDQPSLSYQRSEAAVLAMKNTWALFLSTLAFQSLIVPGIWRVCMCVNVCGVSQLLPRSQHACIGVLSFNVKLSD